VATGILMAAKQRTPNPGDRIVDREIHNLPEQPQIRAYNARHASGRSAERPRDSASSSVASRRPLSWGSVPASGT